MVKLFTFEVLTRAEYDMIDITDRVCEMVESAGIKDGIAIVLTSHTTTGIMVNESLPCLETDIEETLARLVPRDLPYAHNHFLPTYGATGGNCPGHLKSMLCGYHCIFPVQDYKMVRGAAQSIYFCEFDGVQLRKLHVEVMGE